jgi:hypothetical protein
MYSIAVIKYHKEKLAKDIKKANATKTKLETIIKDHDQILLDNQIKLDEIIIEIKKLEDLKF